MEFFELYGKHVGEFIAWLSKPETNIPAIKLLQALAALLGATISVLGFYKAWRYAERRLGKRLEEFLENQERQLVAARLTLQGVRSDRSVGDFDVSKLFSNRELKAVLKSLGKRFRSPAKTALKEAVARTEERGRIARKKEELHLKQKAIAHLLLGAIADADHDHQAALIHFQSALELDPEDAEALEYVGFQYLKLGNATQALAAFTKLEALAVARGQALLQAQALRYCGIACEALPVPQPANANKFYLKAIQIFPKSGPQIELAQIYERRGLVSIDLGFRQLANQCLMHALARYAEHERTQKGRHPDKSGTARILAALKRLEEMTNGGPPLSDGDSDNAYGPNGTTVPSPPSGQQQLTQQPPDGERPN